MIQPAGDTQLPICDEAPVDMLVPEILHPWIAIGTILCVFIGLQVRRGASVDLLFLCGLMVVTITGVIEPKMAFEGFANPAVIAIGGLFVVSAGLRATGVLDWFGNWLLGSIHTQPQALRRLAATLVGASAVMLNTPLVAMMMPVVIDWCRRHRVSPSRLLMPLSYLVILGGVCTLIGTSTTLVVNGMLGEDALVMLQKDHPDLSDEQKTQLTTDLRPMGFFEIGYVGLPCAIIGAIYLVTFGYRRFPNRSDVVEQLDEHRREYLVEMRVEPDCRLIGRTVEQAGLRQLPGLFLIEIDHDGQLITPVAPDNIINSGDRLVFTGVVSTIIDLEKIPGLVPAADEAYESVPHIKTQRHLTEVVLSRTSPLIGATVKEANFRQRYAAAVVAVHRAGERVTNKIGAIHLEPGDTLLLQTGYKFASTYRNSRDFYLVSSVEGSEPRRHHKAAIAGALLLLLVIWLSVGNTFRTTGTIPGFAAPEVAAICVAALMVVTRCMRLAEARGALDIQVLLTIAAALGLGQALYESGGAASFAKWLVGTVSDPFCLLIIIYLLTLVFTEMITNVAVAALMLPIAVSVAVNAGCSPRPFVMAIALAASLSFITPVGYQTNLMVMGPGGYRPSDYLRAGLPLAILVAITALILIPRAWPF